MCRCECPGPPPPPPGGGGGGGVEDTTTATQISGWLQPATCATCIILCDTWCGCLFVTDAMGLRCTDVFTPVPLVSLWMPDSLQHRPTFYSVPVAASAPPSCPAYVLFQGSLQWFQHYVAPSWLHHPTPWSSTSSMLQCPSTSAVLHHSLQLHHSNYDGLLDVSISFFSKLAFHAGDTVPYPLQTLRHVVSSASKDRQGQVTPPLSPLPLVTTPSRSTGYLTCLG
jgi:hypothetical protein